MIYRNKTVCRQTAAGYYSHTIFHAITMKIFIHTLILAFAVFVCSFAQGQTVHLILAIDHLVAGEAGDADYSNMLQVMTNGIKNTQIEYTDLNLKDSQAKIFETIRNIRVGNNDTVLFYYSGYGTMNTNNNNALTYCIVQEVGEGSVPTKHTFIAKKSIIDLLQAKNPRLIVVLSDCCSVKSKIPNSPTNKMSSISYAEITLPLYHSLFFESKGLVDINGAQDGKPSLWYSTRSKGLIFTNAFCSCLRQYENQRIDWKTFFPIIQKTTENWAEKEIQENPEYWEEDVQSGLTGQKPKAISLGNSGGTEKPSNGEKSIFGIRCLNRADYKGVTVTQVLKDYPGAKAGLEKGDVILEIDGQKIRNEQDYTNAVDVAGKIMNLKVHNVHNGQILNTCISLQ
jgi:hypothetical protein